MITNDLKTPIDSLTNLLNGLSSRGNVRVQHVSASSLNLIDKISVSPQNPIPKVKKITSPVLHHFNKRIDYKELPEIFQNELKNYSSIELTVLSFLNYRMFSLCSEILNLSKDIHKPLLRNLSKVIPALNLINELFTKNNIFEEEEYKNILANLCSSIIGKLSEVKINICNEGVFKIDRLIGIVDEFRKTANGTGMDLIKYKTLLFNVRNKNPDDLTQTTTEKLSAIQSTTQEIKIYFHNYFLQFIENNIHLKSRFNEHYKEFSDVKSIMNKYIDYFKSRNSKFKKSGVTIENIIQLHEYTYKKLINFTHFHLKMKIIKKVPFISNIQYIDESNFNLPVFNDYLNDRTKNLKTFQCVAFNSMIQGVRVAVIVLRQNFLSALNSCAKDKNLTLDILAAKKMLGSMRRMQQKITNTKFQLINSTRSICNSQGIMSMKNIFEMLEKDIDLYEKTLQIHLGDESIEVVGELYLAVFFIKLRLNNTIKNTALNYLNDINDLINEFHPNKGKSSVQNAKKNQLYQNLRNFDYFMQFFEKYCPTIIDQLENFTSTFLKANDFPVEFLNTEPVVLETKKEEPEEFIDKEADLEAFNFVEIDSIISKNLDEEAAQNTCKLRIGELKKELSLDEEIDKTPKGSVWNVKTRTLIGEILSHGYQLVKGQGKGSHQKYKKQGQKPLIIPKRMSPGVTNEVYKRLQEDELKSEASTLQEPTTVLPAKKKRKKNRKTKR